MRIHVITVENVPKYLAIRRSVAEFNRDFVASVVEALVELCVNWVSVLQLSYYVNHGTQYNDVMA